MPKCISSILIILVFQANAFGQYFDWVKSIGGVNTYNIPNAIDVDSFKSIIVCGRLAGIADFDPSPATFNLSSAGMDDIYIAKYDSFGNMKWAKQIGSSNQDTPADLILDRSGSSYVTGYFTGSVDFDPGPGTFFMAASLSFPDIFILKLDSLGNFVWSKRIGGGGPESGESIAMDSSSNILITGSFSGSVDFDPDTGSVVLVSGGNSDPFIAKLDSFGNLIYAKHFSGPTGGGCGVIVNTSSNACYVGGYYLDSADFDTDTGVVMLSSMGLEDCFVVKLDSSGDLIWAKSFGGTASESIYAMATDSTGSVYYGGWFNGTTDLDPGSGIFSVSSAGTWDAYIAKLDSNGNFVWGGQIGDAGPQYVEDMQVNGNGNIYVVGYFTGNVDLDPGTGSFNVISAGQTDLFVAQFDLSGSFMGGFRLGGQLNDGGQAIDFDQSESIIISGIFASTMDFNPGSAVNNLTASGNSDAFILKLRTTTVGESELLKTKTRFYPNPANDLITLSAGSELIGCSYSVMDIYGKELIRGSLLANETTISLGQLSAGAYIIQIHGQYTTSVKFIKS